MTALERTAVWHWYRWLTCASATWAIANCAYVYFALDGQREYRIESSVYLFALVALVGIFIRRPDRDLQDTLTVTQNGLLLAIPCALWLIILAPSIGYPFLSDDYVFLELYDSYAQIAHAPAFFRPGFAALVFTLERLGGGSPIPFHVVGFLLHLASACLVYWLVHRMYGSRAVAVVAFPVFLLNPLQLEAVLWMSGLQETLWTTLLLAAIRCYVGSPVLTAARLLGTLALVSAALLTKETAVCFVLLLPIVEWVMFGRRGRLQAVAYVAFVLTLLAYLLLRGAFVPFDRTFLASPSRYFVKQFVSTPYRALAQPWNEAVADPPAAVSFAAATLPVLLVAIAVVKRRIGSLVLVGPAIVLVSTLPVYTYFYIGSDLVSARYLYLAAAGWAMFIGYVLVAISSRLLVLSTAVTALSVALSLALDLNLRPWRRAGELVTQMSEAAAAGRDPAAVAAEWAARFPGEIVMKDGVPHTDRGVGIFANGYAEFLARCERRRQAVR